MKIGLDFGMTNSTISYFDEEANALVNFQPTAVANAYIPTVVSYNIKNPSEISIGETAKDNLTSKSYDAYEGFKLQLGEKANEKIKGRNKSPIEATGDFIRNFLEEFKNVLGKPVENIVMTVPETWIREQKNRTARENIEQIFTKIGFTEDTFRLMSEPEAAASYFCYAYEKEKKSKYKGFITIIDYGGGTLDVTLFNVEEYKKVNKKEVPVIKVLDRYGCGEGNKNRGCAGLAFDEAVTEKLISDNKLNIPKERDNPRFINLRNKFEKRKIGETKNITEKLKIYFHNPNEVEDTTLFSFVYNEDGDEISVKCEDVKHCFDKVNTPVLNASLNEIKQYFDAHGINSSSQDNFKVFLAGGFSNFYPVEAAVREFFESDINLTADNRFENFVDKTDKSFAISRGAALIAGDMAKVEHTCPWNIGIIGSQGDKDDLQVDVYIPIIKKGTPISEIKTAYADEIFEVKIETAKLRIFLDDGRPDNKGRIQTKLEQSFAEILPVLNENNGDKPVYKFGFSVSKNLIPSIHIKNQDGKETKTSLNELMDRIGIVKVK